MASLSDPGPKVRPRTWQGKGTCSSGVICPGGSTLEQIPLASQVLHAPGTCKANRASRRERKMLRESSVSIRVFWLGVGSATSVLPPPPKGSAALSFSRRRMMFYLPHFVKEISLPVKLVFYDSLIPLEHLPRT